MLISEGVEDELIMARVTAIIPARLVSKRFSGKILHPINGKPLIFYVWRAAIRARLIDRVFVATDSVEIGRAVNGFGGAVIMTSARPRNGTERCVEAISAINTDLVINIQGDNLGLSATALDRVIKQMMADKSIMYATLARKIQGSNWKKRVQNPNVTKVIGSADGHALWFSRYPLPYVQGWGLQAPSASFSYLEHIGVYFFRRKALMEYADWPRSRAEKAESLEQLRILENGGKMRLFLTRSEVISVDSRQALNNIKAKLL